MRYSTSIKNMVFLFVFTILTAVSCVDGDDSVESVKPVSYTHLRAHET